MNYCFKKNEEERNNFFSETKSLHLTLSSQWYVENNENNDRQKNLDFVNWCFRLGCYFISEFSDEPVADDDKKTHTVETERVEGASGEAIKIKKIEYQFQIMITFRAW